MHTWMQALKCFPSPWVPVDMPSGSRYWYVHVSHILLYVRMYI